jgi:hypothetical protein
MNDLLQRVRDLQFKDRSTAEALLLSFLQNELDLAVTTVELTPKPTSLNSFNGFATFADGQRLFFKTHTEIHTIIQEYYNAQLLADAGYPVVQPVFQSSQPGKQFLMYKVVEDQSVFDIAWEVEQGQRSDFAFLETAQNQEDDKLLGRYLATLGKISAAENSRAPIHQLFYHRLVGGRLANFYHGQFNLGRETLTTDHLFGLRWVINGIEYTQSLQEIIAAAISALDPEVATAAVIGHGDAHNGNVFFSASTGNLTYFDPAFAGRHHPLLDLTKPMFHNVFASWMYHPLVINDRVNVAYQIRADKIIVDHNYTLHPVRSMFLESKVQRVLTPLLYELNAKNDLIANWQTLLRAALFCCPFLTMNLADRTYFPWQIGLLGICLAVEMGANSRHNASAIHQLLLRVAP